MLSKRRRDEATTAGGRPRSVLEALTDRQREALEIAYRAGYYDSAPEQQRLSASR